MSTAQQVANPLQSDPLSGQDTEAQDRQTNDATTAGEFEWSGSISVGQNSSETNPPAQSQSLSFNIRQPNGDNILAGGGTDGRGKFILSGIASKPKQPVETDREIPGQHLIDNDLHVVRPTGHEAELLSDHFKTPSPPICLALFATPFVGGSVLILVFLVEVMTLELFAVALLWNAMVSVLVIFVVGAFAEFFTARNQHSLRKRDKEHNYVEFAAIEQSKIRPGLSPSAVYSHHFWTIGSGRTAAIINDADLAHELQNEDDHAEAVESSMLVATLLPGAVVKIQEIKQQEGYLCGRIWCSDAWVSIATPTAKQLVPSDEYGSIALTLEYVNGSIRALGAGERAGIAGTGYTVVRLEGISLDGGRSFRGEWSGARSRYAPKEEGDTGSMDFAVTSFELHAPAAIFMDGRFDNKREAGGRSKAMSIANHRNVALQSTTRTNGEMSGAHDNASDCVVSFPGGGEWTALLQHVRQLQSKRSSMACLNQQQISAGDLGLAINLACVFSDAKLHPRDPEGKATDSLQCYCQRLGTLNNDPNCGYKDAEGNPRLGDDGCEWFRRWLNNVKRAHELKQELHVVQRTTGYADTQDWDDWATQLGRAQYLEVLTLKRLGYDYTVHENPQEFFRWLEERGHIGAGQLIKLLTGPVIKLLFGLLIYGGAFIYGRLNKSVETGSVSG